MGPSRGSREFHLLSSVDFLTRDSKILVLMYAMLRMHRVTLHFSHLADLITAS